MSVGEEVRDVSRTLTRRRYNILRCDVEREPCIAAEIFAISYRNTCSIFVEP